LKAYRIAGAGHVVFDGTGAELRGGRWNSPGRKVIYAGSSFAIAMLERLVYTRIGTVPVGDLYVEIEIPAGVAVEVLDPATVPGWDSVDKIASRAFADAWFDQARTAVLAVPSAVTPLEQNVVINQTHPDFRQIVASAERLVVWDQRFFAPGP
jgi:RES domain-containing protein